ncbi:hypothetical protein K439DRAFT_1636645 [Ramaria rubella]|nr:hypothetical protein K439DRAFT_1636645 [Ramaria rubella]
MTTTRGLETAEHIPFYPLNLGLTRTYNKFRPFTEAYDPLPNPLTPIRSTIREMLSCALRDVNSKYFISRHKYYSCKKTMLDAPATGTRNTLA